MNTHTIRYGDSLTPVGLKLKRKNLMAHFAEAIEGMYQKPGR